MKTELERQLELFQADKIWINDNYHLLVNLYTNQWIAVLRNHVVASDPELQGLLKKLPTPANTCVEFITQEPLEMILWL